MKYKVYKIFEADFNKVTKGMKVAPCMRSSSTDDMHAKNAVRQSLCKPENLNISEKIFCSFCNAKFEDQAQEILHYKSDWHRYNLNRKLDDLKPVTEEKFTQLEDDMLSILGSESESEDGKSSDSIPSSVANLARHTKVFFENEDGKILSMYRCLLHGKKEVPENDEQLIQMAMKVAANPVWAIIMLGGGHFAAGIFQGQEVLVHKTFHCYTVRSRQGGAQSSRDGRSGGSHPKSAGANLRRYNEAALIQHVQDIMESWSSQLDSCGLILYRAVGHNGNVLFSGRNPPLNKTDSRLRTIPFATRRATFSEVKRVYDILTNVEMYGSGEAVQTYFPQTSRKQGFKSQAAQDERINYENTVEGTENTSPKRGSSKHNIDRAKPQTTTGSHVINEERGTTFYCLQAFCDTVPQEMKDKTRHSKDNKMTGKRQHKKKVEKDLYSASVMALRRKLWASCRIRDTDLLVNSLQICRSKNSNISRVEYLSCLNENVGENRETLLHVAAQGGHLVIVRALLEAGCDPSVKSKKSQTPYVVSANKETRNTFRRFWADFPGKYDYSKSQIVGPLTDDMDQKMAKKRQQQRKAKRERKREEVEKQRFLQLSDREKNQMYLGVSNVLWTVPFQYDIHRFCSMDCLKRHRLKLKNLQHK
ncbi:Ankyrin repeat and zinc finger domain-containing protein 1 [Cryptotermes secundus]|uniref:Ankyrin repeat and zinc finger domain-containing protein 1 n=1 Tax=Cryptotermes secundus TaxID=105785 RepID=A0A2J7RI97_9NEOP|nr:Ankyrin repeat and zinc finger domain-containing protein 1 [Cryptotermes secundus]